MATSNLVPYAFVWEKGKATEFSETIVVYDIKVGRCSQSNDFNFTSNGMVLIRPQLQICNLSQNDNK